MSFDGHKFSYGGTAFDLRFLHIKTSYQDTAVESTPKYDMLRFNRSNQFFIKSRKYEDGAEWDVELISEKPISVENQRNYTKLLFNSPCFKKLQLTPLNSSDTEYSGVYYNCVFTDETKITIGANMYGWKCKMVCDAPYAWANDNTATITSFDSNGAFTYTNTSDDVDLVIPKLVVTARASGTIKIQNTSSGVMFIVNDMSANETLTIDQYGQMSSSTDVNHYDDWNKVFLYLQNGENNLFATNISSISITQKVCRRIGV